MDASSISLVLFALGTVCLSFVIGANVYEQVVCVPNWVRPGGLEAYRAFARDRHAGYFFLTFAPAALVCLAAGTALGWKAPGARDPYALYATLAVLGALIFTRVYFIPRNRLLFLPATATHNDSQATVLLRQWIVGNYVRVAVAVSGLVSALIALRK